MLAQRRRRWPIITAALCQCIVLSGKWSFWRHPHCYAVPQQTRDNHPMLFQCWAGVEGCSSTLKQQSIHQTQCWISVGPASRRLTGIGSAMGYDAGPTLNQNWVGRPISCTYVCKEMRQPDSLKIQVLNRCWPAPAMVVEGIHIEDIFKPVSLAIFLIAKHWPWNSPKRVHQVLGM